MIYLASKDKRTPWYAKALILFTVGYALSPIDLIPDFIPVLGYVDDILLIPAFIALCIKLIPPEVIHQCRLQAENQLFRGKRSYAAAFIIMLLWALCLYWLGQSLYFVFIQE